MSKTVHIIFIVATLVILFISGLVFYLETVRMITSQVSQEGVKDILQIYDDLAREYPEVDFQRIVMNQAELISAHIVIVDTDYNLLADSHKAPGNISGKYITADLSDARGKVFANSTLRSTRTGNLTVSVAQHKKIQTNEIIIQVVYRVDQLHRLSISFLILIVIVSLLLSLLTYLLVLFFVKQYQKPIKKLLKYTRTVAGGGYSKISVDTSSFELKQLVENFNTLVDRYNLLIESDNKKYSRINTLLANMQAGILMVDTENTITLVNPQAEKLLNLNKSKLFRDRDKSVCNEGIISKVLLETGEVNRNLTPRAVSLTTSRGEILDISIQAIFNKYIPYEHSGALVYLQDVTEIRRLERLKDEFVSNVSHEFRTPLTVIGGFIETLKSWDLLNTEDRNTSVNIIEVETERLKKLISELMVLSRIEGDMNSINRTSIDPSEIAGEVFGTLQHFCKDKNLMSSLNITDGIKPVYGMASWFRQIIFNLYDNAIKYTPPGGRVGINISCDSDLVIEIRDSGPGIPLEEREKIFERFYRRDKSRNSRIPGSGLGLSITRQMVTEFKGKITILDNKDIGLTFRVVIPWR